MAQARRTADRARARRRSEAPRVPALPRAGKQARGWHHRPACARPAGAAGGIAGARCGTASAAAHPSPCGRSMGSRPTCERRGSASRCGPPPRSMRSASRCCAAWSTTSTRNALQRPAGAAGDNAIGILQACGWMTGFPMRTGFARGVAEHDPWRFDAVRLVENGEADCALWISAYGAIAPAVDTRRAAGRLDAAGHPVSLTPAGRDRGRPSGHRSRRGRAPRGDRHADVGQGGEADRPRLGRRRHRADRRRSLRGAPC